MIIHCKYDDLLLISDLKKLFNPENPNKHSKEQIDEIIEQFNYQGIRDPGKISKQTKLLVVGHGRILAAEKMGLETYPIVYQDFESPEQEYAYMTADNALQSWSELDLSAINIKLPDLGPNFNIKRLAIKNFTLDPSEKGQCDEDEVPEVAEPRTKLGDLYLLGRHRLLCGDSTDSLQLDKLMNGENADMVFTDPPYGISAVTKSGVLSKKYKSDIMNDDSTEIAKDTFNVCVALQIPKMVFCGANYYSSHLPDSTCWLVWDKNNGQSDQMDCELAWTNLKGVTRQFTQASEKTNRVHPTQKPVSLAEWCFERYEAGSVLDLFGGSGSTIIACEKTNRKCFMMELDPHYCDVIVARWEKFTGLKAELVTG